MLLKKISREEIGSRPILVCQQPALRGFEAGGEDERCTHCGQTVLLLNVVDGEVWDVVFQCPICAGFSAAPEHPSGRGLCIATSMRVPTGVLGALAPHPNESRAVMLSEDALRRRCRETGTPLPGTVVRSPQFELRAEGLRTFAERARSIFAGVLPEMMRADETHRVQGQPRHRLIELITNVEASAHDIDNGSKEVDVVSAVELSRVVELYERWRRDPGVPSMIVKAKNQTDYYHDVFVLAAASAFSDSHLGAELHAHPSRPAADLKVRVALRRDFVVEVKTPTPLQRRPATALRDVSEIDLIRRSMKSAWDQLAEGAREDCPGILMLGGIFWQADYPTLVAQARAVFEEADERRSHILGVLLSSMSIGFLRDEKAAEFWDNSDWQTAISFRWIPNPHYQGWLDLTMQENFLGEMIAKFDPNRSTGHRT